MIRITSTKNERTKISGVSDTVNPEIDWLRKYNKKTTNNRNIEFGNAD